MDRRDALKLFGCAGLSLVTPLSTKTAHAEEEDVFHDGPFVFCLEARGGWDTTMICDPKGTTINRLFDESGIENSGPIRFAPVGNNRAFFEAHASELLVINGIQIGTNSHRSGERHSWSGCLPQRDFPTLEAMVAASYGQKLPLAYISFGGFAQTSSLVPLSRFRSVDSLRRIMHPNHIQDDASRPFHSDFTTNRIDEALAARLSLKNGRERNGFLHESTQRSMLHAVRLNSRHLARLQAVLPADLEESNSIANQIDVALAACKAGIAISVKLMVNGFDTHNDNDSRQGQKLTEYFNAVERLLDRAQDFGLRDKIIVVMGSEFGRTPVYNEFDGKDHWPIGSAMILGPGIRGNRVIGATDENQKALAIDPLTLEVDEANGIEIVPADIHRNLRKVTGVDGSAIATEYPLGGTPELDLFS